MGNSESRTAIMNAKYSPVKRKYGLDHRTGCLYPRHHLTLDPGRAQRVPNRKRSRTDQKKSASECSEDVSTMSESSTSRRENRIPRPNSLKKEPQRGEKEPNPMDFYYCNDSSTSRGDSAETPVITSGSSEVFASPILQKISESSEPSGSYSANESMEREIKVPQIVIEAPQASDGAAGIFTAPAVDFKIGSSFSSCSHDPLVSRDTSRDASRDISRVTSRDDDDAFLTARDQMTPRPRTSSAGSDVREATPVAFQIGGDSPQVLRKDSAETKRTQTFEEHHRKRRRKGERNHTNMVPDHRKGSEVQLSSYELNIQNNEDSELSLDKFRKRKDSDDDRMTGRGPLKDSVTPGDLSTRALLGAPVTPRSGPGLTAIKKNVKFHLEHRMSQQKSSRRFSAAGAPNFNKGRRKSGRQEPKQKSMELRDHPDMDYRHFELIAQLNELYFAPQDADWAWHETARWLKFEEDVEFGAERWGKPHLPTLSFHSLLELRHCIDVGVVLLDRTEKNWDQLVHTIVDSMAVNDQIREDDKLTIDHALRLPPRFVSERRTGAMARSKSFNSLHHFYYRQQSMLSPNSISPSMAHTPSVANFYNIHGNHLSDIPEENSQNRRVSGGTLNKGLTPTPTDPDFVRRKLTTIIDPNAMVTLNGFGNDSHSQQNGSGGQEHDNLISLLPPSPTKRRTWRKWLKGGNRRRTPQRKGGRTENTAVEMLRKRLPKGTEYGCAMVAGLDYLEQPAIAFVRMATPLFLPNVTEMDVPVRFVFIIMGPLKLNIDYHEVGRSICTLFSDKLFQLRAREAFDRQELLTALNEYLDDSIVIHPGAIDQQSLLNYNEIKLKSELLVQRRKQLMKKTSELEKLIELDPLLRTGEIFGGMRQDLSRRFTRRHYKSDFTDAWTWTSLLSVVFIFMACVFPCLTFGAILSKKTNGALGVKESLLATSAGGVLFALFSAQPLLLIGISGPMLIFEESLYKFCVATDEGSSATEFFVKFRVWVALWAFVFCVIATAVEASFLIKFVTRFSDDILCALVSTIFITECIYFIKEMFLLHPVVKLVDYCEQLNCTNGSISERFDTPTMPTHYLDNDNFRHYEAYGHRQPNTALLSTVLMLGTFMMAYWLRRLRNSKYFGRHVRTALGDFGLSLAIITMVVMDLVLRDEAFTSKLVLDRFSVKKLLVLPWPLPLWVPFGSVIGGFLLFLVLFVETNVAELMMTRKDLGLKKGSGLHWDLLLCGALAVACAAGRLPWLCVVSVRSMAHLQSLTIYKLGAPGEKPEVERVVEQRVTGIALHVCIGLCLLAENLLQSIPVPVLFGVFLYLGCMNMKGVQMFSRLLLFLVPVKYHPLEIYCLRVQTLRMHQYTLIQLACFAVVCVIKSVKVTAFAFPFGVAVTVLIRKYLLPKLFEETELIALDGEGGDTEGDFYEKSRLPV